MKRALIFYASIGSGHLSAARAVQAALEETGVDVQAELQDVFGPRQQKSRLPEFLAALSVAAFPGVYDWSWRTGSLAWAFRLSLRFPPVRERVLWLVETCRPDVIVCTHALPCALLASSPQPGLAPLVAVCTDFQVHPYWPVNGPAAFSVAGTAARRTLERRGYPSDRIHETGIPIHPNFFRSAPEARPGLNVMVIAGGGRAAPYLPIRPLVRALMQKLEAGPLAGVRWSFVFGAAEGLQEEARHRLSGREDVQISGYVEDMPERMAAADVLLTKPGGLTLAEALAAGKPVILLSKGVGQEAANARVVLAAEAAVLAGSPEEIFSILLNSALLDRVQLNARALGKPDAARKIAELIAEQVQHDENR